MVYVTLGTDKYPFTRLLTLLEPVSEACELVIQHGTTTPSPRVRATWHEYVSYEQQVAYFGEADAVISHAGVGTVMTAIAAGHRPLVVARQRRFGEHVDDHQQQIAGEFSARGLVVECESVDALLEGVVASTRICRHEWEFDKRLHSAVATAAVSKRP